MAAREWKMVFGHFAYYKFPSNSVDHISHSHAAEIAVGLINDITFQALYPIPSSMCIYRNKCYLIHMKLCVEYNTLLATTYHTRQSFSPGCLCIQFPLLLQMRL